MLGNPTLGVGSITHAWLAVAVAAGN
jgi:hypothetical protein